MNFDKTIYESLVETSIKYPNNHALLFMKKYFTYHQLIEKVDRLASGFQKIGIKKGNVVTLAMPNVFEAVFALYSLNSLGVICHIVHPLTPLVQMEKYMKQTNSQNIIILDTFFSNYQDLIKDINANLILVTPTTEFGLIKNIGYNLINHKRLKKIKYSDKVLKLVDLYLDNKPKRERIDVKKTAFLLHSGGTSGEPKAIELSNYALNYLASKAPYIMNIEDFSDIYMLAVLPMFHGFGLCMGIHAMLSTGGVDTLMPKFSADEAIKLIKKNRINIIIGVPSLFESLLRNPRFKSPKIKNIMQTFVGGDIVSLDLKDRFDKIMEYYNANARLLEGYGLTEVVTVCSVNTLSDNNQKSVGKALPGLKIEVIDQETKLFLEPNTPGEIVVKGPTMMNGYLNDLKGTNEAIITLAGEKWIKTGDLGFIDEEGYVYFKQRLKRIIKVSGVQVLPSEIENLLMNYIEIKEVAAVGVKDDFKGSIVKLYIAWNKDANPLDFSKIKQVIKENLSIYAVPKEIVVLDELPKTIIGKINTIELEKL